MADKLIIYNAKFQLNSVKSYYAHGDIILSDEYHPRLPESLLKFFLNYLDKTDVVVTDTGLNMDRTAYIYNYALTYGKYNLVYNDHPMTIDYYQKQVVSSQSFPYYIEE